MKTSEEQIENKIENLKQQIIDIVVSDLKQQLFNSENKTDFVELECAIRSANYLIEMCSEIDLKYHELSQSLKDAQNHIKLHFE